MTLGGAACYAQSGGELGAQFGSVSVDSIDGGGAVVTLHVQNGSDDDQERCNGTVECTAYADANPRTKYDNGDWTWAQEELPTAVGITCRCR